MKIAGATLYDIFSIDVESSSYQYITTAMKRLVAPHTTNNICMK